ncbi:MAG TPA: type IV pilus secretin PilQ [Polyangiaceae bacterium]|nr:type IV pilus secretin PilQ [Polyangiaceae bacterium]
MSPLSTRLARALSLAVSLTALSSLAFAAGPERVATHLELKAADSPGSARLRMSFSEPPTYTARLERGGTRLIVDVPSSLSKSVPSALLEKVGVVSGVMVQSFAANGGRTTRLLLTLLEVSRYSVAIDGNDLVVAVAPGKEGHIEALPRASVERAVAAANEPCKVLDVRFQHAESHDEVVIDLSQLTDYKEVSRESGRRTLTLACSKLSDQLTRTLDVSAFAGRLSDVSSYSRAEDKSGVVIDVDARGEVDTRVSRRGSSLVWTFVSKGVREPSTVTGVGLDGGTARKTRTVHIERPMTDLQEVVSGFQPQAVETRGDGAQAGAFGPNVLGQQARAFTGRRIDLDLKDADIHNVLRLLADVGQVNIVTADNVQGSVTIRMRNVPWDQALDIVLQSKGLGMVRQANMIRVAPMEVLEKERAMQIARRQQEVLLAPIETRLIPVSYAQANELQDRARPLLSERGSIAVDERTNVLIVRDVAGNLNQIEELTRSLDTQTPQVLVEARIVEATSRYIRDVGIQWGGDATFSAATGNPTGLAFPNAVGVAGGASDGNTPTAGLSPFANSVANPNFAVNLPAAVGTGSGGALGLTFGSIDNTINLAVRLSAAESSGMLRILSSPRILTLDNREARISQGTLIPFSQVSAQGVQTTFQEAKLQLLVKPHVTADGSVSMHVKINRDEPDFNQTSARGDPTILKREAETDLLVLDGHTAVIGGIFTRNTGRNLDQVPFFGDIPLIGLLFQRRRASDSRGELVIFLTPRIVNRAEALGR